MICFIFQSGACSFVWGDKSIKSPHGDGTECISDSVTRVTIFGDSDSTRVTFKNMVTRLDSGHFFYFHRMTRLDSSFNQ